jgi:transcriptional regulator NrdR family protein
MNTCPNCQCPQARVIMTCRRASGQRYRRFQCTTCTHRWSVSTAEGEPQPRPKTPGRANYETRRMTNREAALIMLSYDSLHEIAKSTGFSYGTIYEIKHGRSYTDVYNLIQPLLDDD